MFKPLALLILLDVFISSRSVVYIAPIYDEAGIMILAEDQVFDYTAEYQAFIYHHNESTPTEELENARSILGIIMNAVFKMTYVQFGVTKTGPDFQQKLGLKRVPGFYLHLNSTDIVRYKGEMALFAILDFITPYMGKIVRFDKCPITNDTGLYEVNKYNYNKFLRTSVFAMVYFYDKSTCTMCAEGNLALLKSFQEKYADIDGEVVFGSYSVRNITFVAEEYNITSLPTLIYSFMNGQPEVYTGKFDKFEIQMLVTHVMGLFTNYVVTLNGDRFKRYLKMKPAVIVKFVSNDIYDTGYLSDDDYSTLADMSRSWKHPCVFAKLNITEYPNAAGHIDNPQKLHLYKWGVPYRIHLDYIYKADFEKLKRVSAGITLQVEADHHTLAGRSEQVVIVGVFPGKGDLDTDLQTFQQYALNNRFDTEMVHTLDRQAAERFNVNDSAVVIIYPTDCIATETTIGPTYRIIDMTKLEKGEFSNEIIRSLKDPANFPLICSVDYRGLYYDRVSYTRVIVTVYIQLDWGLVGFSHMKYWSDKLRLLAAQYRSKQVYFTWANEDLHYDTIHQLGLREGAISEILFTVTDTKAYKVSYPTPEELDDSDSIVELIVSYVEEVLSGNFKPGIVNKVAENGEVFMARPGVYSVLIDVRGYYDDTHKLIEHIRSLAAKYDHITNLQFGMTDSDQAFFKTGELGGVYVSTGVRQSQYTNVKERIFEFSGLMATYGLHLVEKLKNEGYGGEKYEL